MENQLIPIQGSIYNIYRVDNVVKRFKHESRQRILSKGKKRKREEDKSPFLKGC